MGMRGSEDCRHGCKLDFSSRTSILWGYMKKTSELFHGLLHHIIGYWRVEEVMTADPTRPHRVLVHSRRPVEQADISAIQTMHEARSAVNYAAFLAHRQRQVSSFDSVNMLRFAGFVVETKQALHQRGVQIWNLPSWLPGNRNGKGKV